MKTSNFLILIFSVMSFTALSFDCNEQPPEKAGFHNMVLFGSPDGRLYVHHLPLFTGDINGKTGHVLMHVYQALWQINFDQATSVAYQDKFSLKSSTTNPFPFFSLAPQGTKFKIPEMICQQGFATQALVAYGHVESNPQFPAPEPLLNSPSQISVVKSIFARKFDGSAKESLTYMLFGDEKQLYLAHYLTDDENSFDQIVAVETQSSELKALVTVQPSVLVTISQQKNMNLLPMSEAQDNKSPNNQWMLPTNPLQQQILVDSDVLEAKITITGSIYFNNNSDLMVK